MVLKAKIFNHYLPFFLISAYVLLYVDRVGKLVFGSDDDIAAAAAMFLEDGIIKTAWDGALLQGRVTSTLARITWLLPYSLTDSFQYIVFLRFIYFFSCIFLLFLLVHAMAGRLTGIVFIGLFAAFINYSGWYNPLTGYMFWFFSTFIIYIWSAFFVARYFETSQKKYLFWHLIFYIYSVLSYEIYFVGFIFFIAIYFYSDKDHDFKRILFRRVAKWWTVCLAFIALIYGLFRAFFPSQYEGTQISFRLDANDIYNYFGYTIGHLNLWVFTHPSQFSFWSQQIQTSHIYVLVVSIIVSVVFTQFIKYSTKSDFQRLTWVQKRKQNSAFFDFAGLSIQKTSIFRVLLLFQVLLFNLPLFLTKKYQALSYLEPYVSSLPSTVLLLFLVAIELARVLARLKAKGETLRPYAIFMVSFLISLVGVVSNFSNIYFLDFWNKNAQVWPVMYEIFDQKNLETRARSTISTSSLPYVSRTTVYSYWERWFDKRNIFEETNLLRTKSIEESLASQNDVIEAVSSDCGVSVFYLHNNMTRLEVLAGTSCESVEVKFFLSDGRELQITLSKDVTKRINPGSDVDNIVLVGDS